MWTIAIADDYPVVRQVLKEFFASFSDSFKVIGEAGNGKELLEIIEKKQADFILMDITMPFLDGLEATRILKKELAYPGIIITYTGYPKAGLGEMAKKAGAREHLVKPLNLLNLKQQMLEEYSLELKERLDRAI